MKKKLSLLFVALLAMTAFAGVWKATGETPVEAGSTYVDDAFIEVKTVFATTLKTDAQTIGGQEFTNYIQVRVKADPSATNGVTGTDNSGSTPLVITAKKDAEVTFYYRRQSTAQNDNIGVYADNDGKDLKVYDQEDFSVLSSELVIEKEASEGKFGYATKTVKLTAGKVYTVAARGTTIQFYGLIAQSQFSLNTFAFNTIASTEFPVSANSDNSGDIIKPLVITDAETGAKLTVSPSTSNTPNRFWAQSGKVQLRAYGGTLTFEAPEGEKFSKITINNGKWNSGNGADTGTFDSNVWTGEAEKVVVTIAGNTQMNSIEVEFAKAAEPEPTSTSTIYDFEDGNTVFTATYRMSVAIEKDDDKDSNVLSFNNAGNAQNGYGFTYYEFANLIEKASNVKFEFDYWNAQGGRGILTIGDAEVRGTNGAGAGFAKNTYGAKGAIFRIGSDRNNGLINGNTYALSELTNKWLHVEVSIDVFESQAYWTVTDANDNIVAQNDGEEHGFWQEANAPSQIDVFGYINNNKGVKIDNLKITATIDPNIKFADYTIQYVDGAGNQLKESVTRNSRVGNTISLLDADKNAIITDDGVKFIYASDNAETEIIAENGTVITVVFTEAPKYTWSVKKHFDSVENPAFDTVSGETYEGDTKMVYYPVAVKNEADGYYYTAPKVNNYNACYLNISNSGEYDVIYTKDETISYASEIENMTLEGEITSAISWLGELFNRFSMGIGQRLAEGSYFYTEPLKGGYYTVYIYGRNDGNPVQAPVLYTRNANGDLQPVGIDVPEWGATETTAQTVENVAIPAGTSLVIKNDGNANMLSLDYLQLTRTGSLTNDLEISPEAGDIAEAIAEAAEGNDFVNLIVNLTKDGKYTANAPIEAGGSIIINGNGATIDASANEGAFIQLSTTPAVEEINSYFRVDNITIKDVTVNNVKNSIVWDNNTKYCVVDLTIDNSIFALATEATKNQAFISFQQGGVKDFTMKNSTVYQTGAEENNFFLRYNNSARLDRYGYDKNAETQSISYLNNTFYNVGKNGQWGNYSGVAGQAYSEFHVVGNIWYNSGNGQVARRLLAGRNASSYATCEFNNNTYWFNGAAETGNTSYDEGTQLTTDPKFRSVTKGDFAIDEDSEQAKNNTGDQRWGTWIAPVDVVISPESGNINDAIAAVAGEKAIRNVTINLIAGAEYTVNAPIEAGGSIAINGAEGAKIDASANEGAFIQLSATPAVEEINSYFRVDNITIKDVTVKGVKNSIIYDNNAKYCIVNLTIDNSVLELATEAVQFESLIAFQAGGVKDFTIKNSTVYGNNAVAKYFIRYNNNSRLDRYGFDKNTEFQTMTYLNNTFYGLLKSDGQWGNYNGISGQVYSKFEVKDNIWYNCGKDIIRRMAGGRFNGSNPMEFSNNTYFNEDKNISESEANYDKSGTALLTNPKFANVETGDFTVGASTEQALKQTGDPRWLVEFVEAEDADKDFADIVVNPAAGTDIAVAIAEKEKVVNPLNITVNLEAANYTISEAVEGSNDIIINGHGATIDASAVSGALVKFVEAPAAAPAPRRAPANPSDYIYIDNVIIKDVTITGIKGSIFYDDNKKLCVENFTIDNAVLGLATEATDNQAFISFKAGGVKDFTMKNSTVYQTGAEESNFFLRYNNAARLDRYGYDKETETQSIRYLNNTFYNVGKNGQWGNYNGIAGQAYSEFHVVGNIWYNSGNGQVSRRLLGGRNASSYNTCEFNNNTYWFNGAAEAGNTQYDASNQLPTDPQFADAANGDFHIGAGTAQAAEQTGDPRWLVAYDPSLAPIDNDIAVNVESGSDLAEAFNDAEPKQYFRKGLVTLNLEKGGNYQINSTIKPKDGIIINGNGATIDASSLPSSNGYFIWLNQATTENQKYGSGNFYRVPAVKLSGLNIQKLSNALVYQNSNTICVEDLTVDNCIVNLNITTAGAKSGILYFSKGFAKKATVKNSTFYKSGDGTGNINYFLYYSVASDRTNGYVSYAGYTDKGEINYSNNTFYDLGRTGGSYTWSRYYGVAVNNNGTPAGRYDEWKINVESNLWVNCFPGKNIAQGIVQISPEYYDAGAVKFNNNSYITIDENGSYTPSAEGTNNGAQYDLSGTAVTGKPFFRKLSQVPGDFTLGICQQIGKKVGDPRWYNVPVTTYLEAALKKAAELLDAAQPDWQSADAANASIAALAEVYNENTPYLASDSQEEIDEATARVEAAIAAFSNGTTGIAGVNADADNDVWYTTNGQRINKPTTKGIYIHNGKKVVVK